MDLTSGWAAAILTIAVLVLHEIWQAVGERATPQRMARTAHATLREDWFEAVSAQKGSEVLAVQTLRNAVMSASIIASTSTLGLMGTVTLAAPSLHAQLGEGLSSMPNFSARLAMELALLALLSASLICSVMAVRYYNHAGFIGGMPVESETRRQWASAGAKYVRRAGILYSWGLRQLVLVAPVVAFILHPFAGPVAAVIVSAALIAFDRFQPQSSRWPTPAHDKP